MAINLLDLPIEILTSITLQCPNELKGVCKLFYVINNGLYFNAFKSDFGLGVLNSLINYDYPCVIECVKGHDYWRKPVRMIVSNWNKSVEPREPETPNEVLDFQFINDSWMFIYSIYKSHRVYIRYHDYKIENDDTSVPNVGERRRSSFTNIINFKKRLYLTPGVYNFSCGVILKNGSFNGLTSTEFSVLNGTNGNKLINYMPPSHLKDLIPMDKFIILDMGAFEVKPTPIEEELDDVEGAAELHTNLIPIDLIMEETIQLLKSDFIICYLDVNGYSMGELIKKNDELIPNPELNPRVLAWWIDNEIPNPDNVINTPLKNLYKSIDESMEQLVNGVIIKRPLGELRDFNEYNENFYSRVNPQGEEIIRSFKFMSVRDLRRSEFLAKAKPQSSKSGPLKWKMNTLFKLEPRC